MADITIYQAENGTVEVRLEQDTVWLRQEQMSELFGRERSVITKHLRNVFAEGELDEESNVQNLHIAGSDKPVRFYNLDVIISVGYRVKSQQGTRFRQWATRILHEHLTRGYTLNRQRLETNARELEAALLLVRKAAHGPELLADTGRGAVSASGTSPPPPPARQRKLAALEASKKSLLHQAFAGPLTKDQERSAMEAATDG